MGELKQRLVIEPEQRALEHHGEREIVLRHEQRFREREQINYKSWKITDEDWRNRGKWEDYMLATQEMLLKTSTPTAPWTLVESNDKLFSRIQVLRAVADKLRHALK